MIKGNHQKSSLQLPIMYHSQGIVGSSLLKSPPKLLYDNHLQLGKFLGPHIVKKSNSIED